MHIPRLQHVLSLRHCTALSDLSIDIVLLMGSKSSTTRERPDILACSIPAATCRLKYGSDVEDRLLRLGSDGFEEKFLPVAGSSPI